MDARRRIRQATKNGNKEYFLLVKPAKGQNELCFEVVAALPFPYSYIRNLTPINDQVLLIYAPYACSLDGATLDEVIALAEPSPQRPFNVRHAWRVQSTAPYFVPMATQGLRCNTCIGGECY